MRPIKTKRLGCYSLVLGILAGIFFIFVLLGNRSMYFVVIDLSIIGGVLAILGLIFDKRKGCSLASIGLLLISHIVLWLMNNLGK